LGQANYKRADTCVPARTALFAGARILRDTDHPMSFTLHDLGWSPFFARQPHDAPDTVPYRISAVHRDRVSALGEPGEVSLTTPADQPTGAFAVGDWVFADKDGQITSRLDRQTLIQRRAAGKDARAQLIAANVDVLFIVTSCNADFNVPRLERYLALAYEAGCQPVILLTKADLCDDADRYTKEATQIDAAVPVLVVNAKDHNDVQRVATWCKPGQTAAFLGSSGVGKTTVTNGLSGIKAATGPMRVGDAKGRHVTTSRTMIPMVNGGWIIDTPGMRELQLFDADEGIDQLFDDIADLAQNCRFSNCNHDKEPGCAVQQALKDGDIEPARLARWEKLKREDRLNSQTMVQSRTKGRAFSRHINKTQRGARSRKGR